MNICYWNIQKNTIEPSDAFNSCVRDLLNEYSIDIFCVSEFEKLDDTILLESNYELVDKVDCAKVKCYKKAGLDIVQIRVADRYVFLEYKAKNVLFVFLHLYDSMHHSDSDRLKCMIEIKREIDGYIVTHSRAKVLMIGDFNCMPYDDPIMNKMVFNCVLFRDLLKTKSKANERYYNPMLLKLSEKEKIYGSYYSDSTMRNLRWFLLDQVIVNKHSDKIIKYDSIELINKIGSTNLLKNGKPNKKLYSDHLPLYFEIKEK